MLFTKTNLLQQVLHLRSHGVTPSTPLYRVMTLVGRWKNITLTMTLKTLKTAVDFYRPNLVFEAKDVSA